jgi:hypothetical protein
VVDVRAASEGGRDDLLVRAPVPTVVLDGWEIVTSDLLPSGVLLPLGFRAVVSQRDYERVRGRKVIAFPGAGNG